jgi:hypothetical protein
VIPFILLLVLLPWPALASAPTDFARGFALETEPGFALQRLELPFEVHNASVRADLGDLRVFNAQGAEVPLHVRALGRQPAATESATLPLFRVWVGGGAVQDFRLQVLTSDRGTVLSTRVTASPAGAQQALLLDATAGPGSLRALRFELGMGYSVLVRVSVRGSDDLFSWHDAGDGVLARMEHQNGRVLQDRVPLRGRSWKYYLVSGEEGLQAVTAASGEAGGIDAGATRRFVPLHGTKVEERLYEYALPPSLPVDVLDLVDEGDAVLGAEVFVPAGERWRSAGAASLFRLAVDGRVIAGPGLGLRGPLPRFRVRVQGAPAPLRVGWQARELVFMAQGEGPFILAMGNPSVERGPDILAPMLADGGAGAARMGSARLGAPMTLGGEERLRSERDYAKLALWAVLVLGVALLAAMTWHLARSMPKGK